MFRERINKTQFDQIKYDHQIQTIFSEILLECSQMQDRFDKDTRFGILAEEQNNWILNIEDALEQYAAYNKIHVYNMNPHSNHAGL
jgi:hypothetical protein